VDEVARDLVVGMSVVDAEDEYVGKVTDIDSSNASFVVRGALVDDAVHHVPFGQVAQICPDDMCITLLIPKDILVSYNAQRRRKARLTMVGRP
jgi:sporulation protein YlmC with PRC-barrel domain